MTQSEELAGGVRAMVLNALVSDSEVHGDGDQVGGAPCEVPGGSHQEVRGTLVTCQPSGLAEEEPKEGRRVELSRAGLRGWNRATCEWTRSTG
jgi:hypothetical protein